MVYFSTLILHLICAGIVAMANFVVLISGKGSNLEAICKAGLYNKISCVISNVANALGLDIAKKYAIPIHIINHKDYTAREAFDEQLIKVINGYNPDLIVLAGFMRILSPLFIKQYPQKIINIHPSILPSFIGINAALQAFNAKVKLSGATVHFVTDELDHGPIIAQGIVPINAQDVCQDVENKILNIEHLIYPFVINKILTNQVKIDHNGFVIVDKSDEDAKIFGNLLSYIFY